MPLDIPSTDGLVHYVIHNQYHVRLAPTTWNPTLQMKLPRSEIPIRHAQRHALYSYLLEPIMPQGIPSAAGPICRVLRSQYRIHFALVA